VIPFLIVFLFCFFLTLHLTWLPAVGEEDGHQSPGPFAKKGTNMQARKKGRKKEATKICCIHTDRVFVCFENKTMKLFGVSFYNHFCSRVPFSPFFPFSFSCSYVCALLTLFTANRFRFRYKYVQFRSPPLPPSLPPAALPASIWRGL